jgi:TolB-like protein
MVDVIAPAKHPVYEFSGFRLDMDRRQLYSPDGRPVTLTSRVFDTLRCFVQHRGELLDKATLMQAVWPDTVVEENNLNQAITALRKALGEKRGEHRFIVTEPGRGYRFVAEVTVSGAAEQAAATGARQALPNSVAVLPFENLSPNPNDAYFAAGIHDEIINRLAKVKDLSVIACTSVMQYAGISRPVEEIASELRVQAVLEGSVRYADNRIRLTAQLIDGRTGTHLWSEAYSRELKDVFAIQTDIADAIASALEARLLPAEQARLEKPPTDSPAAYALFLEAGALLNIGKRTASIALLDRAIALDPQFALAYAHKAYQGAWALVNATVAAPRDPGTLREIERRALDEADRALALDNNVAVAWVARAIVNLLSWRWNEAAVAFARAFTLSPNDANVLREYAGFKADMGEFDEAIRLARRQAEINPNDSKSNGYLSFVYNLAGRFDDALPAAEKALELAPGDPLMAAAVGFTRVGRRDVAAAAPFLRTSEQLITDESGQHMPALIYSYGLIGLPEDAMRLYGRFQLWADSHSVGAGDWVYVYLGIGERDMAYDWLSRAAERVERHELDAGFFALRIILNNVQKDPILEQPRFRALRDRLRAAAKSQ